MYFTIEIIVPEFGKIIYIIYLNLKRREVKNIFVKIKNVQIEII